MAYLEDDDFEGYDDESISTLLESDDDDEAWEPATQGEAVGPRYRRNYARRQPRTVPRPKPARPVGGLGGATINTPAGRAQMRFEKPVATKESVDASIKELKRELAAVASTVKRVDETVDKNTAVLDKKVAALESIMKKGQQGSQMGMLLPLLLSKPADLASLKIKLGTSTTEVPVTVTETKYKEGDNLGLLIAIMAMSGGMGGGTGGGESMNMLLPLLLVSGGLGGSK